MSPFPPTAGSLDQGRADQVRERGPVTWITWCGKSIPGVVLAEIASSTRHCDMCRRAEKAAKEEARPVQLELF